MDIIAVPGEKTIEQQVEEAKSLAVRRCVAAGGNSHTTEVVEVDIVPVSYTMNGATQIIVRVVADLSEGYENSSDSPDVSPSSENFQKLGFPAISDSLRGVQKGLSHSVINQIDVESYRPRIHGNLWYLSEIDLQFLRDGTGVLAVGSCGEPYPSYLAC